MISKEVYEGLRVVDRSRYPELDGYSRGEVFADAMGGGALFLAVRMARTMGLQPGELVLDLGCGKGSTAIFLAKEYGVRVVAVDLWISATFLADKFAAQGLGERILSLNLDATGALPFARDGFDAIFCMNSLSFYGGSVAFLVHLLRHLKPGGLFCVGMETLSREFTAEQLQDPPPVYHYHLPPPLEEMNVWEDDFLKMHSPAWWEGLFAGSGLVDVVDCFDLEDAVTMYEDGVRYQIEHDLDPDDVRMSLAQLAWGRENEPSKTLFVLLARKR